MSIPIAPLRYAGTWSVSTRYNYCDFVISPIDNKSYVVYSGPITGGADPSVQPSAHWYPLPENGDITQVVAGLGLSGGGSTGVVNIANAGVLSVDGATGALTTKCGGWHKNSNQTISTIGSPSTVSITWQQSSYGDTTTISQTTATTFTVNQNGIYDLSIAVQYANFGTATFSDPSFRIVLLLTRAGSGSANIMTTTFDFPNNIPTNPTQILSGSYQLNAGDVLTWQTIQYLATNSFTINGQFAAPLDFDYNTYWNWTLIKPLP